jgi:hypothetical protein
MDGKTIGYWISTGLFAFAMTGSGLGDVMRAPPMIEAVSQHMGYPVYFLTILGVWKLLGVVALIAPGLGRAKEWAYAGFFFTLTGAAASHAFSGEVGGVVPPMVMTAIAGASWALRPASRWVGGEV